MRRVVGRKDEEGCDEGEEEPVEEKIDEKEKSSKIPNKKAKELLELNANTDISPLNIGNQTFALKDIKKLKELEVLKNMSIE